MDVFLHIVLFRKNDVNFVKAKTALRAADAASREGPKFLISSSFTTGLFSPQSRLASVLRAGLAQLAILDLPALTARATTGFLTVGMSLRIITPTDILIGSVDPEDRLRVDRSGNDNLESQAIGVIHENPDGFRGGFHDVIPIVSTNLDQSVGNAELHG